MTNAEVSSGAHLATSRRRGMVEAKLNGHKFRIDASGLLVTASGDQFRLVNGADTVDDVM
jgi:hypothetical protein